MKIIIETNIAAPINEVWRAFNDPDDIVQWDASDDWHTVSASNDLKIGGQLLLRTEGYIDDSGFDFAATYTQIELNRLIEFREDNGRVVRLEFVATDDGVTLRQTFDAESEIPEEQQRAEWQSVIDRFARYVEKLRFKSPTQTLFRQKYEAASNYQGDDDYHEATFRQLIGSARLELPAYADDVITADMEALYSDLKFDIEQSQWFEESFPNETFALIIKIIRDPRFLATRNGWSFLMIYEAEWEKITESQKAVFARHAGRNLREF